MSQHTYLNMAASFCGIPYTEGGATFAGVNCVGLVELVLHECCHYKGEPLSKDPSGKLRSIDWFHTKPERLFGELERRAARVDPPQAKHGDLYLFYPPSARIQVCFVASPGRFLYIQERGFSALGELSSAPWRDWYHSCWRLTDLEAD